MAKDYFAELYVAGLFADKGWNIYFPHRDEGFDFIISKNIKGVEVIRPVQVKGKYPKDEGTKDRLKHGYIGELNKIRQDMILAIPFFSTNKQEGARHVAYMPFDTIKPNSRGYRCQPAMLKSGKPLPRRDYRKYFNEDGLMLIEETKIH